MGLYGCIIDLFVFNLENSQTKSNRRASNLSRYIPSQTTHAPNSLLSLLLPHLYQRSSLSLPVPLLFYPVFLIPSSTPSSLFLGEFPIATLKVATDLVCGSCNVTP